MGSYIHIALYNFSVDYWTGQLLSFEVRTLYIQKSAEIAELWSNRVKVLEVLARCSSYTKTSITGRNLYARLPMA